MTANEMEKMQVERAKDLLRRVKDGDPVANIIIAYFYEGKNSDVYERFYKLCKSFCDAHLN